jgi:hypothetical protein
MSSGKDKKKPVISKEQLAEISKRVAEEKALHRKLARYGLSAAKYVKKLAGPRRDDCPYDFDSDTVSSAIGAFLTELLHRDEGWLPGTETLAIEWGIERLMYSWMNIHMPLAIEIHKLLQDANATEKKPFVWNDLDCRSFFVPHDKFLVWYSQGQNDRWLFVHEDKGFVRETHVRLLSAKTNKRSWPRQCALGHYKKNGFRMDYGDCRDCGYVLSMKVWKNAETYAKIDRGMYYIAEIKRFISEVSWLHLALTDSPE